MLSRGPGSGEARSKRADQVGSTIDLSQGMRSQKRQKGNVEMQLTGLPVELFFPLSASAAPSAEPAVPEVATKAAPSAVFLTKFLRFMVTTPGILFAFHFLIYTV